MQFLYDNILLIYILPVFALFTAFGANFFKYSISENTVKKISIYTNAVNFVYVLLMTYCVCFGSVEPFGVSVPWLNIGNNTISLGVLADKYSLCGLFIVTLTALIVQLTSLKFLKQSDKTNLFCGYFNLLLLCITAFILSSNLIQAAIIFSLAGVCTYLILNLDIEKYNIAKLSQRFFIIDRIGDICLLSAIFIMIYFINAYEIQTEGEFLGFIQTADNFADFYVYMSDGIFYSLCLLIFIGISVKSAIFPFHSKMAVMFYNYPPAFYFLFVASSVMGGLIVLRLLSIFELSPNFIYTVFVLFAAAVFYSFIYALINRFYNHIKIDYGYLLYSCLAYIYIILPLTVNLKSDITKSNLMLYFSLLIFAVLYIFWIVMEEKNAYGQSKMKATFYNTDFVTKIGEWIFSQVSDFLSNIVITFDKYVYTPAANIIGYSARINSWIISFLQNGKFQNYLIWSILFISVMLVLYLFLIIGAGEI